MSSQVSNDAATIRNLLEKSGPLKAREISRRLWITQNIPIDTSKVHSLLYGMLSSEVERLADFSWRVKPVRRSVQSKQPNTVRSDFEIEIRKALAYINDSSLQHAIDACKRAILLQPKAAMPHCIAARAYARVGSPKKSVTHFEKALALGPMLGKADLLLLATAYEKAGEPKRAAECFQRLIRSGQKSQNVWRGYLDALRHSFQYEATLSASSKALKIFPKDHEILWYRAVALEKLNRIREAYTTYKLILRIAPDHERAPACAQNLAEQLGLSDPSRPIRI